MKNLDRICDVEGVPVTDKEFCKKQIVKGLKVFSSSGVALGEYSSKHRRQLATLFLMLIDCGWAIADLGLL